MEDMTITDWGQLAVLAVAFLVMASAALWTTWALVRMQPPVVQRHAFGALAVLLVVVAGCIVYFVRQPSENEEQAGMVVLAVMLLTAIVLVGYAFWIRQRFHRQIIRWEIVDTPSPAEIVPDEDKQDGQE